MLTIHVRLGLQIYKVLNIRVVGLRAETWTNRDLYTTGFSSDPETTLIRFRNYARSSVRESFDAAILIT